MVLSYDYYYKRKRKNSVALYQIKGIFNDFVVILNLKNLEWFKYSIDDFNNMFYRFII